MIEMADLLRNDLKHLVENVKPYWFGYTELVKRCGVLINTFVLQDYRHDCNNEHLANIVEWLGLKHTSFDTGPNCVSPMGKSWVL